MTEDLASFHFLLTLGQPIGIAMDIHFQIISSHEFILIIFTTLQPTVPTNI